MDDRGDVREVSIRSSRPEGRGYGRVWYRLPREIPPPPPEALGACAAATGLPIAMARGEPLEIEGRLCDRLREGMDRFQEVFRLFDWRLRRVPVDVKEWLPAPGPPAEGVGALFSGGLDSFYTALTHPEIDRLVLVRGADIGLDDDSLWSEACERLAPAAAALGKRLVTIETNVRAYGESHRMQWPDYHGAALCGLAHLLSGAIGRVFLASSFNHGSLLAWGSHPLLDPAWSSARLEIVHDGCDVRRAEKAEVVARSDVAMRALRVCFQNRGGRYNCGVCPKCVRTLVNFRIAGALDRCVTFERPLDLGRVRRGAPASAGERAFLVENVDALRARGGDPELLRALTVALEGDGSRARRWLRRVRRLGGRRLRRARRGAARLRAGGRGLR